MEIAKTIAPLCLAIIMFGLGLGLTISDFTRVVKNPRDFFVGFICQVILLPIVAFFLIQIITLPIEIAMGVMINALSLMAEKRRLFVVPTFLSVLSDLISQSKNEITAEVVSAQSLSKGQAEKLAKSLKNNFGKDVKINATVDPTLIGGMVVKVGSRMIDTTIRAKLNSLQNTMKEVG